MTEHITPDGGLSRRQLIAGLGAATGAASLLAALPGGTIVAGPARPAAGAAPAVFPEVLQPLVPGLTYVGIDAAAFSTPGNDRYLDDDTGAGAVNPPDVLHAPLTLAAGAVIEQLNVVYVGAGHRLQVWRRTTAYPSNLDPPGPTMIFDEPLPDQGAGPHGHTFETDLTIEPDSMYTLRVPVGAGESILGVTVGYSPPAPSGPPAPAGALGFVPLEPPTRPLDTRQPGPLTGKLAANEERIVDLGLPAGAKAAALNLTITHTETSFGYVSVFAAGIPWPGNSSINWSSPDLTAANAVITAVDDQGRVTIRGGEASTDVIIDVVGSFVEI